MLRVWKWLRESGWKWLREHVFKAIILATLIASFTGWLRSTFDAILRDLLPSGAEISCIGRKWIIDHSPFRQPGPTKEVFRILVATLDHDNANRTLTEAVVGAFQGEKGIEAIETCRVLKIEGAGERIEEAVAKKGQEWLSWHDADVLVFGEVRGKGEALNLHFLPVGSSGDFHQHAFELKSGFLLLKGDFSEAVGAQLQAVALATVKPATEEIGKYLVETLRPVTGRLKQLIRFTPSGLSAGQLADIQFALGVALSAIGEQAGDNKASRRVSQARPSSPTAAFRAPAWAGRSAAASNMRSPTIGGGATSLLGSPGSAYFNGNRHPFPATPVRRGDLYAGVAPLLATPRPLKRRRPSRSRSLRRPDFCAYIQEFRKEGKIHDFP